jgi:hypothetical protein
VVLPVGVVVPDGVDLGQPLRAVLGPQPNAPHLPIAFRSLALSAARSFLSQAS